MAECACEAVAGAQVPNAVGGPHDLKQSRPQESEQDDKWSFCLTAGTLCPTNQER